MGVGVQRTALTINRYAWNGCSSMYRLMLCDRALAYAALLQAADYEVASVAYPSGVDKTGHGFILR